MKKRFVIEEHYNKEVEIEAEEDADFEKLLEEKCSSGEIRLTEDDYSGIKLFAPVDDCGDVGEFKEF